MFRADSVALRVLLLVGVTPVQSKPMIVYNAGVGIIEDKVVFPQIFSNDFQTSKSN